MKVVVAAAGQGTRFLPLTENKPKHLLEVNGKPFLVYVLDNLLKAGYKDLVLVTGFRADLVSEFLKENNYKATVINQYEVLGGKEKIYGTACPLMCIKEIIGKENFVFVSGDGLYSPKDLKEIVVDDNYNYVAGIKSEHPEKYGVLFEESGFLKKVVEKPKEFIGNLVNVGLYKFTSEIFEKLSEIQRSVRGEYEITDAINLLAEEKKVKVKEIKDYWLDFGSPADIIKISQFLENENL